MKIFNEKTSVNVKLIEDKVKTVLNYIYVKSAELELFVQVLQVQYHVIAQYGMLKQLCLSFLENPLNMKFW